MRRRTLCPVLMFCVGGLASLGTASAWAAGPAATEPIRLTSSQMDMITAGTALVGTDASAIVVGDRGLALTSAQTLVTNGPNAQQVGGGGSSAFGIGSSFVATNSSTAAIVGDGVSNAAVFLDASSVAAGGTVLANAFTQVLGFDSAVADVALGLAQSVAGGGERNVASATSDVGGGGGKFIAGSVTRLVQTPRFSIAQATAFAITINPSAATLPQTVAAPSRNSGSAAGNRARCL